MPGPRGKSIGCSANVDVYNSSRVLYNIYYDKKTYILLLLFRFVFVHPAPDHSSLWRLTISLQCIYIYICRYLYYYYIIMLSYLFYYGLSAEILLVLYAIHYAGRRGLHHGAFRLERKKKY